MEYRTEGCERSVKKHLHLVHTTPYSVERDNPIPTGKKTCKSHCTFYNEETGCPAYKGLDYGDPLVAARCLQFTDYHELEKYYKDKEEKNMEEKEKKMEDLLNFHDDLFRLIVSEEEQDIFNLIGRNLPHEDHNYPFEPNHNYADVIEGLEWYISPDKSFGCWIKNNAKGPVLIKSYEAGFVPKDRKYRSYYPLHNHQASESLLNRMVWNINEKGFGEYRIIVANEIRLIDDFLL